LEKETLDSKDIEKIMAQGNTHPEGEAGEATS